MRSKKDYVLYHIDTIRDMVSNNVPKVQIAKELNLKVDTLSRYLKEFGIKYCGNQGRKGFSFPERKTSINKYLNNEVIVSNSTLRKRLIEEGLKDNKCECCGLSIWMDKPIPLELHHKDGNHYNNNLTNLAILCSNCHMQAHNYSNISLNKDFSLKKRKPITRMFNKIRNSKELHKCEYCGKDTSIKNKFCSNECYRLSRRCNIPDVASLISKFKELKSFVSVSKFYGVSDNAVRKWCKNYNILHIVK